MAKAAVGVDARSGGADDIPHASYRGRLAALRAPVGYAVGEDAENPVPAGQAVEANAVQFAGHRWEYMCRIEAEATILMSEESLPYPVVAVADLANNYSPDHFRFAIKQCRDVLARLTAEDNTSDQQIARVHILRNLDLQLERAVRFIAQEADLTAWVLRNLIELKFWAHFVSDSPANASRFLHEQSIDARELYERLEKLVPAGTYDIEFPEIAIKRVAVEPSGDREALIWKMCSKLIHPSAWVINNPRETIHSNLQRQVWSVHVVYYGWGIINIFHKIVWED